ncbi:MAG TPA: helix-turn-helix domain-containing protein [Noviherbaspirillum sp.]
MSAAQQTSVSTTTHRTAPQQIRAIPTDSARSPLWSSLDEVFKLLHIPLTNTQAGRELRFQHICVKAGQRVHTADEKFESLHVVNSGFLKTASIDEHGNEQVIGFPMKGDVLGIESVCTKRYPWECVALTDCNLIVIPYQTLMGLCRESEDIQNAAFNLLSRDLQHSQTTINMLGVPNAEIRVARFLVHLAERYGELGYSRTMFNLQMTRQEIGNYLGLSLETVSRAFSALNEVGLISVDQRAIQVNELDVLKMMRRIPASRLQGRTLQRMKKADAAHHSAQAAFS